MNADKRFWNESLPIRIRAWVLAWSVFFGADSGKDMGK